MDKADFLQMLTAQLKAQDPSNPLDSQDFAAQLAQFSSVQELEKISSTMDQTLAAQSILAQTFSNAMSTSLIGKTVKADVSEATVGSTGGATISYTLPGAATGITVDIKDSDGTVVRTLTINAQSAGEHNVSWDGMNSEGQHVAAGTYSYTVSAKDSNDQAMTVSTYIEGNVDEIRYEDGSPILIVNGAEIQLGQVLSIRDTESGAKKG
jgi:flagellar basal-body rod modification protein FlgD